MFLFLHFTPAPSLLGWLVPQWPLHTPSEAQSVPQPQKKKREGPQKEAPKKTNHSSHHGIQRGKLP